MQEEPGLSAWQKLIEACLREGVREADVRWYVVRVERYLKANAGCEPSAHTAADLEAYLERAGREPNSPAWLLWQLTHALQIFFRDVVEVPWAGAFDWGYWFASIQALELDHPTLARHNSPISASVLSQWPSESACLSDQLGHCRSRHSREELLHSHRGGVR